MFHFAGIGDIVPSIEFFGYMDVNVQGTVAVLEACREKNIKKFVYAASSSCYGLANTPTDEKHQFLHNTHMLFLNIWENKRHYTGMLFMDSR